MPGAACNSSLLGSQLGAKLLCVSFCFLNTFQKFHTDSKIWKWWARRSHSRKQHLPQKHFSINLKWFWILFFHEFICEDLFSSGFNPILMFIALDWSPELWAEVHISGQSRMIQEIILLQYYKVSAGTDPAYVLLLFWKTWLFLNHLLSSECG